MERPRITVIGAGLCGPLLSIFLAKQGFEVDLYEKRSDMRKVIMSAGRSINLALANRGIAALKEVGIFKSIAPLLIKMKGRMLHPIGHVPYFQSYGQRNHEVIYSISRGELNKALLEEAQKTSKVTLFFDYSLKDIDFTHNLIHLYNEKEKKETKKKFDVILACDGSGSVSREIMLDVLGHRCSIEPLSHGYKELSVLGDHNRQHIIEKEALHIWPRKQFMLIALPNLDGSFTLTLFLNHKGPQGLEALTDKKKIHDFFHSQFPDILPNIHQLGDDFLKNPTGRLSTVRTHQWYYQDKMLLLGDAAHAIVPFHGQGMNCAFEDCLQFSKLLKETGPHWETLFPRFQEARKPNADAIADLALDNFIEMRDKSIEPSFQLKKQLSFELEKLYPNEFIPRYSMVMFHLIPYHKAQRLGVIQNEILNELIKGKSSIGQIDLPKAKRLIEQKLC